MKIEYRPGLTTDSQEIARLICVAGGGLYEFLFDDLIPFMTATDYLAAGVASDNYPISHRNCYVAIDEKGQIIGAANAFPVDLLKNEKYTLLPSERQVHVQSLMAFQDWGSMLLNALAVSEECRGYGIGSRLLCWACDQAKELGFDRVSLHVWADNDSARAFYKARGFMSLGVIDVPPHARLPHIGGSVLMRKVI